ncbi:unnamed protein product [Rotaria sordida]|uniref:NADP-dependent oxidoreductase domain-containing protein n=1 Tax=Rotaria sordida TaxID=392033 RepID=A0A814BL96_9BILA|nr:unnamed protein product [Rotaria sordida]
MGTLLESLSFHFDPTEHDRETTLHFVSLLKSLANINNHLHLLSIKSRTLKSASVLILGNTHNLRCLNLSVDSQATFEILLAVLPLTVQTLTVECVDLYQIHGPIHLRSIEVIGDALAEAVKLGLTKTVGVSNYSTAEMIRMYDCLQKHGIQLASNQVEYSLIRRLPETSGHIAECHKRGVAVLGYCPLGMGGLTGKYSRANPPPGNRVIPLGGAKDGNQAEQNAECLGWRLTNEEITELENHPINRQPTFFESIWQHG